MLRLALFTVLIYGATAVCPKTFDLAASQCQPYGAEPVIIRTLADNYYWTLASRSSYQQDPDTGFILLGIECSNGHWQWTDGSDITYRPDSNQGAPLDGFGECLAMQTNNVAGQWTNTDCSTELPFACIRHPDQKGPVCDDRVVNPGDIIYSPGFPTNASEPCDYILKVDPGMLVRFEILFLEANECCDHLFVHEGSSGGHQLADFSRDHNNVVTVDTSSCNVMIASWRPQGGVNVKGFMITFHGFPE